LSKFFYINQYYRYSEIPEDLFLNFKGESLSSVRINGKKISAKENVFNGNKIHLPKKYLEENNGVDIRYTGTYRKDGYGLHHYVDADDGETYLYTQFETFHASKCFPCFDQPDIKATMKFRSFSPGEWKVISNRFESETTNATEIYEKYLLHIGCPTDVADRFTEEDNKVFRQFETTDKISTYLYAFIVGPYVYESNRLPNSEKYVPMRVMARKSVMKFVQVEEFFKITMSGMDYYEEFFGRKYPFKKYDQIFAPEFNAGAMENVGCVTFTEHYLFRGKVVPQSNKEQLAITILHELAHMWFGNLVTMKWWDDLWLNESFATFMSHMALDNGEALKDYTLSWELFLYDKTWGMKTDDYSSTHPIAADCKTTEDADNIFDGISYGKGSAFLKQLVAYLSEETFKKGLQSYFKKFAFKNTELTDFIGELQSACNDLDQNIDVVEWCDSWIKTSGFNVISSELTLSSDGSTINSFKLFQGLSDYGEN
jgi:aminopeptidase N